MSKDQFTIWFIRPKE